MSTENTTWGKAYPTFRAGMNIIVRRDGFEYMGVLKSISISEQSNELSITIAEVKRKKWPSPEQWVATPETTLCINTTSSKISEDSGGFWYFTLPRANHGMIFQK